MLLFHWNNLESCKNYATGDAVIMAQDIDEARIKLRVSLEAWMAENREFSWLHSNDEDRAAEEAKINADVIKEPALVSSIACGVVISGSQ